MNENGSITISIDKVERVLKRYNRTLSAYDKAMDRYNSGVATNGDMVERLSRELRNYEWMMDVLGIEY